MRDNKIHTPEGVRDFLPVAYAFKTHMERKLEDFFHLYGFASVSSPTFEFLEVFEGKGSISQSQLYKFLDRDGTTLALRADMTPAIARIAATEYKQEAYPLRLCYVANTFRYNESYQGKAKELTQAGIELIGLDTDNATAEVIAIAVKSLLEAGLSDFRMDIGSVQFFKAILEDTPFDSQERSLFQQYILDKDFVSAEQMLNRYHTDEQLKTLMTELPLLIGKQDVITRAKSLTSNPRALAALAQLEAIYGMLAAYGVAEYLSFDLSMIGHLDYYTDIIFRGYTHGAHTSVLDGGRYDGLLSKFGQNAPAVGFGIKVDTLLAALNHIGERNLPAGADTLVAYTPGAMATALSVGDVLRRGNLWIENSLISGDLDAHMAYARTKGISGLLYFRDNQTVEIVNLLTGQHEERTIQQLTEGAGL